MSENAKKRDTANSKLGKVETGLLEPSGTNPLEQPKAMRRIDKKEAYKDLPNILILIGLYFLQATNS